MAGSGYLAEDTIAALATGVGGAIAIVRVSGPGTIGALKQLAPSLWGEGGAKNPEPRKLLRAPLFWPKNFSQAALDDAMVALFPAPGSYTGEDSAELHIHGSGVVAQNVLSALALTGVRQALPGEFSFRAVRNGKMSVAQAEAVADLISASNDGAAALALEKMSGAQNRMMGRISESLKQLAALGEIGIDFADQDVEEVSLPALVRRLEPVLSELRELHESYGRGVRIQEGVSVAFIGLPNAGKSSFFNALLGQDRSIVSEFAGTTRDVVRESVTLQGSRRSVTLRLADTAGLRDSEDHVEKMGVELTARAAREADLLLLVVDAADASGSAASPAGAPIEERLSLLRDQWNKLGAPVERTIGVLSKVDRDSPPMDGVEERLKGFGIGRWLRTSARDGVGVTDAIREIADFCESWVARKPGEMVLTRQSQREALADGLSHLERAMRASEISFFAADLRQALHSLAPLIGETPPDDILGRVFSQFCIGK